MGVQRFVNYSVGRYMAGYTGGTILEGDIGLMRFYNRYTQCRGTTTAPHTCVCAFMYACVKHWALGCAQDAVTPQYENLT